MNNKLDNFKNFVKSNSFLISYIRSGQKSWQEIYEIYDLYGEDEVAWDKFLRSDEKDVSSNSIQTKGGYLEEFINMAKKVDMDKVQEGISSLQKTLGLFGELLGSKGSEDVGGNKYNPRPLYRRFDD